MTRVKVCGITRWEDALVACRLGVHALGFIFAPSPRRVTMTQAREIIRRLPPFVLAVGVFVDQDLGTVERAVSFCGLDLVQLHGDETPDFCRQLMPRAVKTLRIRPGEVPYVARRYRDKVRALLMDTYSPDAPGGTGKTFDWDLAAPVLETGIPVVLSGGLKPSNVGRAISKVRPWAVDVNSGVEKGPGVKDPGLLEMFMKEVRRAEREI